MLPSPSEVEHIASDIGGYKQENKRLFSKIGVNWQLLEPPGSSL
jgi:hypothetical protein